MSKILDIVFPKWKKIAPTAAEIVGQIERHKAARSDAQARLTASGQKRATARESLNAAGMTAADTEAVGIRNEIEVAELAISTLEVAHAEQVKREAADTLTARRNAAERRVVDEAPKLLAEYDRLAGQLAAVLDGLREIEGEVTVINEALHRAGRRDEAVKTIQQRYRFEAGKQDPDRIEIVEEWHERDPDGSFSRAVQFVQDKETGEMVPRNGGKKVKREVRHPGRKRPDTYLAPFSTISLPASRLGGAHHWPRS